MTTDVNMEQRPTSTYKATVSHLAVSGFDAQGRREFFDYRDLGIIDATNSDYSMRIVRAKSGDAVPTGWHYHTCSLQIVFCLKGWEDIALEDGRTVRLEPGSCLNIPPGFVHDEVGYAPDMEVLLITSPAETGTVSLPDFKP